MHAVQKAMASRASVTAITAAALISICQGTLPVVQPEVIKSLEAQGLFTVILALQEPHSPQLVDFIGQLPFPVQVWTRFGSLEVERLKNHTAADTKVIVLIPFSTAHQRTAILDELKHHIIYLSLVRLLFVLEPGQFLPYDHYPKVSCALISLNTTVADVPKKDFWNCTERSTQPPGKLFAKGRRRTWTALRNKTLVGITRVKTVSGDIVADSYLDSGSVAVMRAFRHINVSIREYNSIERWNDVAIVRDIMEKRGDVSFVTAALTFQRSLLVNVDAFTVEGRLGFYSADGRKISSSLSLGSSLPYILLLTFVSACLVAKIYFLTSRLSAHSTDTSRLTLSLFASFALNGTPLPVHVSNHVVNRMLYASWLVGMVFLAIHVQSEITSVVSVPTVARAIETTEDVGRHATSGKIYPCVIEGRYTHRMLSGSTNGALGALNKLLHGCGRSCLADISGQVCIEGAMRGTHVFLIVFYTDRRVHYELVGMAPGRDHFVNFFCGILVSKAFPYIPEHRRLLSAIFESGLYRAVSRELERTNATPLVKAEEGSIDSPLPGFTLLYGMGCVASFLALLAERCFLAMCER